ncbi:MAG: hypothetical protein PHG03_03355 [Bacilli bacterium]|nr:hypothetical protein [Bacilli bacterium]
MFSDEYQKFINQDFDSFSNWLFSLNAYEFSLIASIIGFVISPALTINQQGSLGNFFELLGQVILTINAQNTTLYQSGFQQSCIKPHIESQNLEEEIILIKKELIKLRNEIFNNFNI